MRVRANARDITGIVLVDKAEGYSSSQALVRVRAMYRAKRGGHTGALDPAASGLLPICLGEAAKFSSFFLEGSKRYITTGTLGVVTETQDREGEIVRTCPVGDAALRLPALLSEFTGEITQTPPIYSAVKVAGKPLYKYAREGKSVAIPSRRIVIHELKLLNLTENTFTLEVHCSKGTYIRTLVSDIGETLGVGAYVSALRRIEVEGLPREMHTLDELQAIVDRKPRDDDFSELDALLLPVETAVRHLPVIELPQNVAAPLCHGVRISLEDKRLRQVRMTFSDGKLAQVQNEGRFLGVCTTENGLLIPRRMLDVADRYFPSEKVREKSRGVEAAG